MAGYQLNGLVPFNGIMPQLLGQQYQQNPAHMPSIEKLAGESIAYRDLTVIQYLRCYSGSKIRIDKRTSKTKTKPNCFYCQSATSTRKSIRNHTGTVTLL